jgi:type II secretory pathway component PulK
MTPVLAEAIVAHRNTPLSEAGGFQDFQSVEDVRKVQGMTDEIFQEISKHLVVRSATYEVRARSVTGTVERGWNYVIRRSAEKKRLALLASQRMTDFPSAKPPEEEPR